MPSGIQPGLPARLCWLAILAGSGLSAVGLALLAPRMAPIRQGNSHAFWNVAAGVSLSPEANDVSGSRAYFVNDTWAAYESLHMHGSHIYRVPAKEVSADFGAVVAALERASQRGQDTPFVEGYTKWRDDKDQPRCGPALLKNINQARNRKYIQEDLDYFEFCVAEKQLFWQRWQRANWYWANIVFEWAFLTGLMLFVLWPGIRGLSAKRWAIHASLVPLLFLMPVYFGYARTSFTSAGPSGGVLYPFMLWFCVGGSVTPFDAWVLDHLPQILEPLSVPIGTPMALSGRGMPGPTYAVLAGVLAGILVFAISCGYRRIAGSRRSTTKTTGKP